MTQRLLRTVPAAVLLTTALSWNLPALAQTGSGTGTRPPSGSSAVPGTTPPDTTTVPPSSGSGSDTGGSDTGGSDARGLPADLRPAMPASAASGAQDGAAVRSTPQRQHKP